jgi:endonuclease YncB( thermonuclease family)
MPGLTCGPRIREAALPNSAPDIRAAALAAALLAATPGPAARAAGSCLAGAMTATATVEDARTLRLSDGQQIRPAGVESFALLVEEQEEAEAKLREFMRRHVEGEPLQLLLLAATPDRYGRRPALLAGSDGILLQLAAAREGVALAFAAGEPIPCFGDILAAEDEARRAGRGFWSRTTVLEAQPSSLSPRSGGFAIFEGVVLSVGNRRATTYLNFGRRWSTDVTVEIAARDRVAFGGEAALAALSGRAVRVRGFVEDRGGPLVVVTSPMQIETLGAARNRP